MESEAASPTRGDELECRRCGGALALVHAGLRDRHFEPPAGASGESFSIFECRTCDRCELAPRPSPDDLASLYADYYTHAAGDESGFVRWVARATAARSLGYAGSVSAFERASAWLVPGALRAIGLARSMWLPASLRDAGGGRVLDVGCGDGALLAHLASLGWKASGVEPDARARAAAAKRLPGVPLFASVDEAHAAGARADAVVLAHVVEHAHDPAALLAACRRVLEREGWLVVRTPNPASAARARFGASWLHWDPPRHLQLFGERGLRGLLADAGYRVDRCFSSAGAAHFAYVASALLERDGRLPGIETSRAPIGMRIASIAFWLRELARVARGESVGEEVVAIARPSSEKPA